MAIRGTFSCHVPCSCLLEFNFELINLSLVLPCFPPSNIFYHIWFLQSHVFFPISKILIPVPWQFWGLGHLWSQNDVFTSWLSLTATSTITSQIHIRHLQIVSANWCIVLGHMAAALNSYRLVWATLKSIASSAILDLWKILSYRFTVEPPCYFGINRKLMKRPF